MKKCFYVAAALLLALPGLSHAIPMSWTYSGVCTSGDCSVVPSITGSLFADPEIWGPNNQIDEYVLFGDLTSYSFSLGGYTFSGTRGAGSYQLDAAGNIVGGVMTFANILSLEFLGVGSATWSLTDENFFRRDVNASGSGGYTNATPIPEPAVLSMLGLALLTFGLVRRRRSD